MQQYPPAVLALLKDRGAGSGDIPEENPEIRDRIQSERAIVCATCRAAVTSPVHRITVHESYEHRFMNPAGLLFHIGCFAQAIGCTIVGPDSHEYPWFPGFAWRYALCASCGQHLGWHFRSKSGEAFFGLILDRLAQPQEDG